MANKKFQLLLVAVPSDPVKMTNLRTILINDLSIEIIKAKEILANLPQPIAISEELSVLQNISLLFNQTDAELDILPILEETVLPPEINFFADNIDNRPAPQNIIKEKAVSHKNYSIFEVNKNTQTKQSSNSLLNNPIIVNSIASILVAGSMLTLTYLIISKNNPEQASQQLKEQIQILQTEDMPAIDVGQSKVPSLSKDKFIGEFKLAGLNFECFATQDSKNQIANFEIEALNHKDSKLPSELEKITINNFQIENTESGNFTSRGVMKIYLNQNGKLSRPSAQAVIEGNLDQERKTINLRLLVNRGYQALPAEDQFLINLQNVEETKVFIDRKISLTTQE